MCRLDRRFWAILQVGRSEEGVTSGRFHIEEITRSHPQGNRRRHGLDRGRLSCPIHLARNSATRRTAHDRLVLVPGGHRVLPYRFARLLLVFRPRDGQ